ncbi:MAG: hypothetical protein U0667_02485 [Chloroflexota bacterium]
MAKEKHKDARERAANRLEGRPKALRRELSDLGTELERARERRDRAQARVEALEAIAEQLTVALAAAEAARDRREAERAQGAGDGEDGEPEAVASEVQPPEADHRGATKGAKRSPADASEAEPTPGIDADTPSARPRKRKARPTA